MTDVAQLMSELQSSSDALDKASTRLYKATQEFEGTVDEATGNWQPGPQLRYEEALAEEAARIHKTATDEGYRPPPESVREAMAVAKIKTMDPNLYADYHRLKSEISALSKWMAAKKETISARQSILSTERKLHLEGSFGGQR